MDKDLYIIELEELIARLQLDNHELRAQLDGEGATARNEYSVYAIWASSGALLYAGQSCNLLNRFRDHIYGALKIATTSRARLPVYDQLGEAIRAGGLYLAALYSGLSAGEARLYEQAAVSVVKNEGGGNVYGGMRAATSGTFSEWETRREEVKARFGDVFAAKTPTELVTVENYKALLPTLVNAPLQRECAKTGCVRVALKNGVCTKHSIYFFRGRCKGEREHTEKEQDINQDGFCSAYANWQMNMAKCGAAANEPVNAKMKITNHDAQRKKALAFVAGPSLGYGIKLATAINAIFGTDSVDSNQCHNWRNGAKRANAATENKRARAHEFMAVNANAKNQFEWQRRTLDALTVYYAGQHTFDTRPKPAIVKLICDEAKKAFDERILDEQRVEYILDHLATTKKALKEDTSTSAPPLKKAKLLAAYVFLRNEVCHIISLYGKRACESRTIFSRSSMSCKSLHACM